MIYEKLVGSLKNHDILIISYCRYTSSRGMFVNQFCRKLLRATSNEIPTATRIHIEKQNIIPTRITCFRGTRFRKRQTRLTLY